MKLFPSTRKLQRNQSGKNTGKSQGVAFVQLSTEEDVQTALKLHKSNLDGRLIVVERAAGIGMKKKTDKDNYNVQQPGSLTCEEGDALEKFTVQSSRSVPHLEIAAGAIVCKRHEKESVLAALPREWQKRQCPGLVPFWVVYLAL